MNILRFANGDLVAESVNLRKLSKGLLRALQGGSTPTPVSLSIMREAMANGLGFPNAHALENAARPAPLPPAADPVLVVPVDERSPFAPPPGVNPESLREFMGLYSTMGPDGARLCGAFEVNAAKRGHSSPKVGAARDRGGLLAADDVQIWYCFDRNAHKRWVWNVTVAPKPGDTLPGSVLYAQWNIWQRPFDDHLECVDGVKAIGQFSFLNAKPGFLNRWEYYRAVIEFAQIRECGWARDLLDPSCYHGVTDEVRHEYERRPSRLRETTQGEYLAEWLENDALHSSWYRDLRQ